MRVDGLLHEIESIPAELFPALASRVKVLAGMDVADRRQPQDGRCGIPFEGREIDARVASVPTIGGEKLVVRLLDGYASAPELGALGMPPAILERYRAAVHAPWGFVLVTGPTGSGKTTTLYASLSELDTASRNVCSVEDPVEMRLRGVSQVQVNVRAGITFPAALRAFMRCDPNVVMVGEMRDPDTAAVSVSAALAGQIVFTTLHATDAPRTIDRLVELGVARHSLASALTAVVAQRLVRKLCERCRVRAVIPDPLRDVLKCSQEAWYVAAGCRACNGTGYLGRTGVYELLFGGRCHPRRDRDRRVERARRNARRPSRLSADARRRARENARRDLPPTTKLRASSRGLPPHEPRIDSRPGARSRCPGPRGDRPPLRLR